MNYYNIQYSPTIKDKDEKVQRIFIKKKKIKIYGFRNLGDKNNIKPKIN